MGAPYKWTMAAMIAIVLITGVASARAAAPASYAWFAMGMVIFVGRNFELTLSLQVCVAIAVYISGAPDWADFFRRLLFHCLYDHGASGILRPDGSRQQRQAEHQVPEDRVLHILFRLVALPRPVGVGPTCDKGCISGSRTRLAFYR